MSVTTNPHNPFPTTTVPIHKASAYLLAARRPEFKSITHMLYKKAGIKYGRKAIPKTTKYPCAGCMCNALATRPDAEIGPVCECIALLELLFPKKE